MVKLSPETLILVVSNPCDTLTYITWKLSGLPRSRVFGSGTFLDSSRFRVAIAKKLNVNAQSVHGWIIGEHGDSSVPVWSGVNIAGINIKDAITDFDPSSDLWANIHEEVKNSAYKVIQCKGTKILLKISFLNHFVFFLILIFRIHKLGNRISSD